MPKPLPRAKEHAMFSTMKAQASGSFGRRPGLVAFLAGCGLAALMAGSVALAAPAEWLKTWRADNPVWRGVHFSLRTDADAVQLVEALPKLSAAGVNVILVEVNYSFEFKSHPELRTSEFVSAARAHELARAARAKGIRLIPELNCLGHQSWKQRTAPLLAKHPDFDETPGHFPDNKDIYCRSWCPRNPKVNKVVFALIDELLDGFEADAFHAGMDEVFIIGSAYCPRCRGEDPAKLFARAANDLHKHLVGRRKVEMLIWGDRLLDAKALGYSEWEASKNGTERAIDLLPKDIIVCDWHYGKRSTYPSVPLLLQKGFRVWPAGWQPFEAAQAFSAYARQQKHARLLGYLCTTWGKARIPDAADWPPLAQVLPDWK
jgi:hypothetical protein